MFGRKAVQLIAWEDDGRQLSDFSLWFLYEHLIALSNIKTVGPAIYEKHGG